MFTQQDEETEIPANLPHKRIRIKDTGELGGFVPYPVAERVRIKTTALATELARVPDIPSQTLKACIGMLNIIESLPERQEYAITRNQYIYASGMGDGDTVKRALAHVTSYVEQCSTGQAYDFQTNTAKASMWQLASTVPNLSGDFPYWILAPNHEFWHYLSYGPDAWRLACALVGQFGDRPGVFTTADIRSWTGWGSDKVTNLPNKVLGFFVERVKRGTYRFDPDALWTNNSERPSAVPRWILKDIQAMADIKTYRESLETVEEISQAKTPAVRIPTRTPEKMQTMDRIKDRVAENYRLKW